MYCTKYTTHKDGLPDAYIMGPLLEAWEGANNAYLPKYDRIQTSPTGTSIVAAMTSSSTSMTDRIRHISVLAGMSVGTTL
jgi:hypothetical protein